MKVEKLLPTSTCHGISFQKSILAFSKRPGVTPGSFNILHTSSLFLWTHHSLFLEKNPKAFHYDRLLTLHKSETFMVI